MSPQEDRPTKAIPRLATRRERGASNMAWVAWWLPWMLRSTQPLPWSNPRFSFQTHQSAFRGGPFILPSSGALTRGAVECSEKRRRRVLCATPQLVFHVGVPHQPIPSRGINLRTSHCSISTWLPDKPPGLMPKPRASQSEAAGCFFWLFPPGFPFGTETDGTQTWGKASLKIMRFWGAKQIYRLADSLDQDAVVIK